MNDNSSEDKYNSDNINDDIKDDIHNDGEDELNTNNNTHYESLLGNESINNNNNNNNNETIIPRYIHNTSINVPNDLQHSLDIVNSNINNNIYHQTDNELSVDNDVIEELNNNNSKLIHKNVNVKKINNKLNVNDDIPMFDEYKKQYNKIDDSSDDNENDV